MSDGHFEVPVAPETLATDLREVLLLIGANGESYGESAAMGSTRLPTHSCSRCLLGTTTSFPTFTRLATKTEFDRQL